MNRAALIPGRKYDFRVGVRWKRVAREVRARDQHRCHWCGGRATQADHVIPVVQGGDWYDKGNLVASCATCNQRRGGRGRLTARTETTAPEPRSVFQSRASIPFRTLTVTTHNPRWKPLVGDYTRGTG